MFLAISYYSKFWGKCFLWVILPEIHSMALYRLTNICSVYNCFATYLKAQVRKSFSSFKSWINYIFFFVFFNHPANFGLPSRGQTHSDDFNQCKECISAKYIFLPFTLLLLYHCCYIFTLLEIFNEAVLMLESDPGGSSPQLPSSQRLC